MKKQKLGMRIKLAGLIITPVEEMTIKSHPTEYGIGIYTAFEPIGIIIESVDKRWGLDIHGKTINPEELLSSVK